MKPGGCYTQPEYEPVTNELKFVAYFEWEEIGRYDTDAEATHAVKKLVRERRGPIIESVAQFKNIFGNDR